MHAYTRAYVSIAAHALSHIMCCPPCSFSKCNLAGEAFKVIYREKKSFGARNRAASSIVNISVANVILNRLYNDRHYQECLQDRAFLRLLHFDLLEVPASNPCPEPRCLL